MTLTAIVGAFVALLAPALLHDKKKINFVVRDEPEVEIARLKREITHFERELAMQRSLKAHWRDEAKRLAREARLAREEADRLRDRPALLPQDPQMALYQAMAHSQQAQAAQQQQFAQQAQLAQQNYQGQLAQQAQNDFGFCNCVPSRSQVWAAQMQSVDSLVGQLNRLIP